MQIRIRKTKGMLTFTPSGASAHTGRRRRLGASVSRRGVYGRIRLPFGITLRQKL